MRAEISGNRIGGPWILQTIPLVRAVLARERDEATDAGDGGRRMCARERPDSDGGACEVRASAKTATADGPRGLLLDEAASDRHDGGGAINWPRTGFSRAHARAGRRPLLGSPSWAELSAACPGEPRLVVALSGVLQKLARARQHTGRLSAPACRVAHLRSHTPPVNKAMPGLRTTDTGRVYTPFCVGSESFEPYFTDLWEQNGNWQSNSMLSFWIIKSAVAFAG